MKFTGEDDFLVELSSIHCSESNNCISSLGILLLVILNDQFSGMFV